jgi:oligoendopeptidase F
MKGERSRLRTRVPAGGMNYEGFQVAMHELGHCVEQTISLQKVDSYLMAGVPNTAISEAFAFIFQNRDLEILGLKNEDRRAASLQALDTLWMTYEIMGVALVDMKVWDWMYQKPDANPEALRKAVLAIAREVWNQYYADLFGVRDQIILASYSHMIDAALYLPDYPLGHLVEFQLENFLAGKNLGLEMERMCQAGRLIPQLWLKNAVGKEISAAPLLQAAEAALKVIKK